MLTRKSSQLLVIALLTVVTAVIVWSGINIPLIRPLLALFLIGAVGHTTLAAWANRLALRGEVHALMTVMLGITLVILSGVILNFTPWGLNLNTSVAFITGIILFNIVVALVQKQPVSSDMPAMTAQPWKLELNVGQFLLLAVAVAVTGVSIMIARTGSLDQSQSKFSQLWMVADAEANASQVSLGVKNEEQEPLTYRVMVVQGSTVLQDYPSINLVPDQTWEAKLDLKDTMSTSLPIEALLYRTDRPDQPYRKVNLWLK